MDHITFDKFRESWVLTSFEQIDIGILHPVEPVRILDHQDAEGLKRVLLELFSEQTPKSSITKIEETDGQPGIKTRFFNLKDDFQYFKQTRVFQLSRSTDTLMIEEWTKEKRSWVAYPPVWKAEFRADQLNELIAHLIERTKSEA